VPSGGLMTNMLMQRKCWRLHAAEAGIPLDGVRKVLVAAYKGADFLSVVLLQKSLKLCKLHIPVSYHMMIITCRTSTPLHIPISADRTDVAALKHAGTHRVISVRLNTPLLLCQVWSQDDHGLIPYIALWQLYVQV